MNEPILNPDPDAVLDGLFARARAQRPDTAVAEYAFETRLMARLREKRTPDPASVWATVSWRLSPIFAACVIGVAIWHSQVIAAADEAVSVATLENPGIVDWWNGVD
jgi:hypothetical protein